VLGITLLDITMAKKINGQKKRSKAIVKTKMHGRVRAMKRKTTNR
jgi:hypothetical protein